MEHNQIYIKTAKGLEEIQNRTYKLPAHLRRLLIMVDGHSTAAEMIARLTSLGDVELALDQLSIGGFIALSAPPSAMSDPASQPVQPEFSLDYAKIQIHAVLRGAMGPMAEHRIECVEAVATLDQLRVELDVLRDLLPKVLSKAQAEQTWQQLEPIMLPLERRSSIRPQEATPAAPVTPAPPAFNLAKAKVLIRSTLLSAMGPAAAHRIELIDAVTTPDQLRIELNAICDLLPKVLPKKQAEHTWRQLETIVLTQEQQTAAPAESAALPEFNLDKAKGFIRFILLGAMGPTAARRIERIEATTTCEQLRAELDAIRDMLPKVISKRQAEQAWRQLEPIMTSITPPL